LESTNPFRCYDRRFLAEALIVAVLLIGLAFLGKRLELGSPLRVAMGVTEGIVFGFFVARMLLQIRRLDELGQRIHLLAIAVAFGLSALLLALGEFVGRAGAPVPKLGIWILSFMLFAWGLGVIVISRRYR
jgi:hypothetical protein